MHIFRKRDDQNSERTIQSYVCKLYSAFIVLNMLNIFQEMICISCRLDFKFCDVICVNVIYTFSSKVK